MKTNMTDVDSHMQSCQSSHGGHKSPAKKRRSKSTTPHSSKPMSHGGMPSTEDRDGDANEYKSY